MFGYFQPLKRVIFAYFRKTKKYDRFGFLRRVKCYLSNIFSIFLRFSREVRKIGLMLGHSFTPMSFLHEIYELVHSQLKW